METPHCEHSLRRPPHRSHYVSISRLAVYYFKPHLGAAYQNIYVHICIVMNQGIIWIYANYPLIHDYACKSRVGATAAPLVSSLEKQATGLDAWASRVKCPARFVSHLLEICIYIWVVYSLCFFCCLFITVTWWNVWCIEWASRNQEEVQACLVTLWLFIISCYSLYKTTLGLLCSWFENNPHFHKYSMDFHV